jgi:hypothetical protein
MAATPEELCEYLNEAAEYAGLNVWFEVEPADKEGCCTLRWGSQYAPSDRGMVVHTILCMGNAKNIPDRAKWEDFAAAMAASNVEQAKAVGFIRD